RHVPFRLRLLGWKAQTQAIVSIPTRQVSSQRGWGFSFCLESIIPVCVHDYNVKILYHRRSDGIFCDDLYSDMYMTNTATIVCHTSLLASSTKSAAITVQSTRIAGYVAPTRSIIIDARSRTPLSPLPTASRDRKSTRLNSSHVSISYAV